MGLVFLGDGAHPNEEIAMSNIIPFDYKGRPVHFDTHGWLNATEIARREGRRLDHWLKTAETNAYIAALGRHLNTPEKGDLIRTRRGRDGGTWLHPKLAVAFARWLDVDFAVWCDLHIDAVLSGDLSVKQQLDTACKALEDRRERASLGGRELARWRWDKKPLEDRVNYWREQLQLTLALEQAS